MARPIELPHIWELPLEQSLDPLLAPHHILVASGIHMLMRPTWALTTRRPMPSTNLDAGCGKLIALHIPALASNDRVCDIEFQPHQIKRFLKMGLVWTVARKSRLEVS